MKVMIGHFCNKVFQIQMRFQDLYGLISQASTYIFFDHVMVTYSCLTMFSLQFS